MKYQRVQIGQIAANDEVSDEHAHGHPTSDKGAAGESDQAKHERLPQRDQECGEG